MTIQKRYIVWLILFLLIIILADFSPIAYYKIFPHNGSWPNFYNYNRKNPAELITAIEKIKSANISISYFSDTDKNDSFYTRVVFMDKPNNDYYHVWVLVDTVSQKSFTQIVFGYISKSIDYKFGKRINKDFDYLTNYLVRKRFENIVINKLNID